MITSICPKSIDPQFHLRRAKENVWVDIERDLNEFDRDYCSEVELARNLMTHMQLALASRQAPFDDSANFYKNVQLAIDVLEVVEEVLLLNIRTDNRSKRELTLGQMVEKLQNITVM